HAAPDAVIDLPRRTPDAVRVLREGSFNAGLLLPNSWRSAWQFYRAQIAERWGYRASLRGMLLTRGIGRPPAREVRHQADYYRHLVSALGIPGSEAIAPWIAPRPSRPAEGDRLPAAAGRPGGAELVWLAPGAAYGQARRWPPARMAAVAAGLVTARAAWSVLVGAGHVRAAGRALESWRRTQAAAAAARVVNLISSTTAGALVAVFDRTAAVVANESG